MREIVEMGGVVAFELETRAGVAKDAEHELNVLVSVAEDEIARILQRLALPIVLEILEPAEHREQAEIHRTHIEGSDFRLERLGRLHALSPRPFRRATRR